MKDDGVPIARLDSVTIDCHDPERVDAFSEVHPQGRR